MSHSTHPTRSTRLILIAFIALAVLVGVLILILAARPAPSVAVNNQPPPVTLSAEEAVQTLFAQTAIAQTVVFSPTLNVNVEATVQVPTIVSSPAPVFGDEGREALAEYARSESRGCYSPNCESTENFRVVSAELATNPRGNAILNMQGVEEIWCVRTSPPIISRVIYTNQPREVLEWFLVTRTGYRWQVQIGITSQSAFLEVGCRR